MLTVKEAAARLQVTPERIRNMIYTGVMPAEKFGSNWSIPDYAVEQRLSAKPKRGRPKKSLQKENINYQAIALNHSFYQESKRFFEKYDGIQSILLAETEEEKQFFITMWSFFLQQKQKTLVDQGVY